jgi:cytochrome P450
LATYKELQVPAEEGARFILGISWAAVGNSIPAIFWLFYYLMKNKEAYDAVQAEVESVVQGRTSGNESCFSMDELDQMPVLNSAFTEALRLSHGAFSLRQVLEDVPLQVKAPSGETSSYLLEKGSNVMMLMSIMHQDPTIFPNPLSFDYKRFMPDPVTGEQPSFKRNGKVVDPLRFFGGGSHMCPGRKFIVYEAKAFIASLLQQYDMKLSMDELNGTVGIDKTYQGLGVNKPERDVDVLIRKR